MRAWQEYLNLAEKVSVQETLLYVSFNIELARAKDLSIMHRRWLRWTFTRRFRWNSSLSRHATLVKSVTSSCNSAERRQQYRVVLQLINAIELNRNISRPFFRCVHYIRAFCACKWIYGRRGCRRTSESYCVYAQDTLAPSVTFSTFHPCALFPSVLLPFSTQPSQTTSETVCSQKSQPVIIVLESWNNVSVIPLRLYASRESTEIAPLLLRPKFGDLLKEVNPDVAVDWINKNMARFVNVTKLKDICSFKITMLFKDHNKEKFVYKRHINVWCLYKF